MQRLIAFFIVLIFAVPAYGAFNINTFGPESPWILDPDGNKVLKVDPRGNANVVIQDQHTPTIILPMAQQLADDTLSVDAVINEYTVILTDTTGFTVGQHFRIINAAADRFYFGTILGIATNTLTLDTQIDFVYISGSEVTGSNINMAVDGSVTPVIFKLRTGSPSIPSIADITRVIFSCETLTAVDRSLFGDLVALTRGLAFRNINGIQSNIFNIKTNGELAGIAFDWTPLLATNPSQGVDGFISRLTFAGQSKIGVTLRVGQFDNLEMIVQDDLTGLVSLIVVLEGHVVE